MNQYSVEMLADMAITNLAALEKAVGAYDSIDQIRHIVRELELRASALEIMHEPGFLEAELRRRSLVARER